ncbi:long-chain-acyl-CoA synthetase [Sinimarinibacterium sp. CAU 1509]|uniref:long-chain-acyl-CoA synthetase n=1 Tax=Sinimarinibacterium sp. CAU 1509 TaxID=2562283 RepID=UPI0010AD8C07|nr:long-chain-acyl-CoA synthetase [Sinimarinibacterium sp. CAU 1509]TJY56673.1 long-chain-acyl-CoA synthetase [Sinimarinibacterium sp. CAU 1509]
MSDVQARDVVRFRDLVRGIAGALPDSWTINRGLYQLLRAKPDRVGSIGLRLQHWADATPDQPALVFEGRSWTYAEFNAWANRVAEVLRRSGVGAGDAVAILLDNRPESLVCAAAVVKLGAIAAMINHNQRGEVLAHSLRLTGAKVVVSSAEGAETLAGTGFAPGEADGLVHLCCDPDESPAGWQSLDALTQTASAANPPEAQRVTMRQPCFYIFTSGTTGMPKASVMTHYRWLRGMAGLGQMTLRLHADDTLYCCLPLYHNNALTVSWGAVLGAGATFALGRKFSASKFWDEVRVTGSTAFCYIGELCRYLLNRPASPRDRDHRVRVIVGNGLRPEIWDDFKSRFGIDRVCEFYGASESNLAFSNGFDVDRTAGYCPMAFAIVEFDAEEEKPRRGAKGFMRKVARGGVGLLMTEVSDAAPFDGYTDAGASEAKLVRNVFKRGDCWFNTGDLVRDQGYRHIQFVDRVGDTFRWKGENVATTEVEAALNRFSGVEHAVVYGVQIPGTDGRAGMAALTLDGEVTPQRMQALATHLETQLPAYAVPVFLRMREEHETTATFKFRKSDLKQQGFDPSVVSEPLYVLVDRARGYEPLTDSLLAGIRDGSVRV